MFEFLRRKKIAVSETNLDELGDILQGIALKDAEFARQIDTDEDVEDDCYR